MNKIILLSVSVVCTALTVYAAYNKHLTKIKESDRIKKKHRQHLQLCEEKTSELHSYLLSHCNTEEESRDALIYFFRELKECDIPSCRYTGVEADDIYIFSSKLSSLGHIAINCRHGNYHDAIMGLTDGYPGIIHNYFANSNKELLIETGRMVFGDDLS